jgi:rhamnose utilization protein RhaD (predicted bifunctional aldolase and dehydrogenase)
VNDGSARVLEELLRLSRELGRPQNDYVILAEGNTSALLDDRTFLVKASGARLDGIDARDFVRLRLEPLLKAMLGEDGQDGRTLLRSARFDAAAAQPSIETFVHVACLGLAGARWVGHTHPTILNGLLCSPEAESLFAAPLFPDEVVVCGPAALYVPYCEPGLPLARALAPRLAEFTSRHGVAPRTILLANHGLVALGESPAEVEAVTAMAVKAARIRSTALAAGGLRTLAAASVEELSGRADELERRARLVGGASS